MQKLRERYGGWGLVAGAAEGLGAAFSEDLGKRGMNVIMVDNDKDKLSDTASKIVEKYAVQTIQVHSDLSDMRNLEGIIRKMAETDCRLLVYNAAYGPVKDFLDNTGEELDYYLDLNSRMPLHMIHRFIKVLPKGKRAGILLMSSLAGLWGTQLVVPYGATKAFDYNLAEGLHYEFKRRNVDIMACCAGATDTPNYQSTRPEKNWLGPTIMKPERVARRALDRLGKQALYIPGFSNRLTYFILTRLLSRSASAGMMNRVMFNMYRK